MSLRGSICKGDVIWVPYRKNPWPALVQNVYPKKVTYVFFPLPEENGKKWVSFSCNPKAVYALCTRDQLPNVGYPVGLYEAFDSAVEYLHEKGLHIGSDIQRLPDQEEDDSSVEGYKEEDKEDSTDYSIYPKSPSVDSESPDSSSAPNMLKKKSSTPPPSIDIPEQEIDPSNVIQLGPLRALVFDNLEKVLNKIWNSALMDTYAVPPRNKLSVSFRAARFLSDTDADALFETIVNYVRARETRSRLLPVIHLTAEVLFPEVIVHNIQEIRQISYEEASSLVYGDIRNSVTGS